MSSNDRSKDTARPRFYMQAVENKVRSAEEGRPIFDEREMVEVAIPGDKLTKWVGYVTDVERQRWPDAYTAFKRGEERAASGTPLEQWPVITRGRVAELKGLNILSVEELAGLPDSTLTRLGMGARELREQARSFLETAKAGAGTAKIAADNAALKAQLEMMQKQIASLMSQPAPAKEELAEARPIEELSDAELKAYIKREAGEAPRGNPSRETLLERALEIATTPSEAA